MVEAANLQFADEQSSKARTELRQAIADTREVLGSDRSASIMNMRDKHLAHSLETTRREKDGPVIVMLYKLHIRQPTDYSAKGDGCAA